MAHSLLNLDSHLKYQGIKKMRQTPQIFIERRFGTERRKSYNLDYFAAGGVERRHYLQNRRKKDVKMEHSAGFGHTYENPTRLSVY